MKKRIEYIVILLVLVASSSQSLWSQKALNLDEVVETTQMKYDLAFSEGLRYKMLGNPVEAGNNFTRCTQLIEDRAAPYYELGFIALNMKDLLTAEGHAQTAVNLDADNKWYKLLLIRIFTGLERYTEAAELYANLFATDPNTHYYLQAEIDLLIKSSAYKEALKKLGILSKIDGLEAESAMREKDVHLLMGKDKKAIAILRKLADDFSDDIEYRGILAELLAEKGMKKEAIVEYQKIKESNPDNPIVYYSLGQFYLDNENRKEAIKEFETGFRSKQVNPDIKVSVFMELIKDEDGNGLSEELKALLDILYETDQGHPGIDAMYANYLYDNEKFDEAEEIYERVVAGNPGNFMAWQNLLMIQNHQLDFEEMFSFGDRAVKAFPSQSFFYLFQGIAANALLNYEEAVDILRKGSRLNGGNSDITKQYYISLGDALYHTGNFDEAFRNFDLLLVLDSNNALVLNNYAYYLSELERDLDKGLTMILKCIAIEEDNPTYLDTQAWVLFKLERHAEALDVMEHVMELNGTDASGEVLEHYGDILFKNNKVDQAVSVWKSAIGKEGVSENISTKIENRDINEL